MEFPGRRDIRTDEEAVIGMNQLTLDLVFMVIGIIGYFTIPTVAGWVIQAGGAGNFGKNVNYAAGKGAGIAGAVGGAVGGFAGGHARNAMSYAGSKAKDVAGRLFHRGGNKSPESSEQN